MNRTGRALSASLLIHATLAASGFILPAIPDSHSSPSQWLAVSLEKPVRAVSRRHGALSPRPDKIAAPASAPERSAAPNSGSSNAGESVHLRMYLSQVFSEVERRLQNPARESFRTRGAVQVRITVKTSGEVQAVEILPGGTHWLGLRATRAIREGALPRFPAELAHLNELRLVLPLEFTHK